MFQPSPGRLRSPSDPSGIHRRTKTQAPAQFTRIEEENEDTIVINDEAEFGQWYHEVEEDLLEASHEAYQ